MSRRNTRRRELSPCRRQRTILHNASRHGAIWILRPVAEAGPGCAALAGTGHAGGAGPSAAAGVARSAGGRRHRPGPLSRRLDAARRQPARRLGAHAGPLVSTPLWYRLRFDAADAASAELLGLYIERACANVEVQLNGQQLHAAGRMIDPISLDCQRPLLLPLPAALLQAGKQHARPAAVGLRAAAGGIAPARRRRWRRR